MSAPSDQFDGYEFRPFRVFSAEQHRQLAIECGVLDGEDHGKLIDTMRDVSEMYPTQRGFEETFGSFKGHRERLERISGAASNLRSALAQEPLATDLLIGLCKAEKLSNRMEDAERLHELLLAAMSHLAAKAGELASDPSELRAFRIEPKDGAKSVERREIWEPVFRLWGALGKELGYTEGGPIMRVLQIIHEALGLEPPNAHSVRQALRQFKGSGVLRVVE